MRPGRLPCSSITTWSSSLVSSSFVTNGVLLRKIFPSAAVWKCLFRQFTELEQASRALVVSMYFIVNNMWSRNKARFEWGPLQVQVAQASSCQWSSDPRLVQYSHLECQCSNTGNQWGKLLLQLEAPLRPSQLLHFASCFLSRLSDASFSNCEWAC